MREALFLKNNAGKWKLYEAELGTNNNPDLLAERFVELTDDLAYAKTFYPNSNTTKYLNGLASRFHQGIYKNRKEKTSRIFNFWRFELPYLFFNYQRQLLYSFLFLIFFTAIGSISAVYDDSFIRIILGDNYVNTTLENIEQGNPFGIYQSMAPVIMFLFIAYNNLQVSFLFYISGITASVGTVYLTMSNGIMLGSFITFFFTKGLGWESILAVFIHGTLEILAFVVAGCAGLAVGNSILFPKTFTRGESFKRGIKDGLKIVIGIVPIIVTAAVLESFVTRFYKTMPLVLNLFILIASLLFMIWYFILYPIQLNRRVNTAQSEEHDEADENFMSWLNKKLRSEK
ncbi:MAG: stage II sporulation protein M [Sphingobacteriales bacterium]|nr:MAG: stage II sporulation protein M [Sphingobacteriales bacterium]